MPSGPRRPLWIWVDAAATCNLACKLCYTAMMQSKAVMQLVVFEALMRRLHEASVHVVKFHSTGVASQPATLASQTC